MDGVAIGDDVACGVERREAGGGIAEALGDNDVIVRIVGQIEKHVVFRVAVRRAFTAVVSDVIVEVGVGCGGGGDFGKVVRTERGDGLETA